MSQTYKTEGIILKRWNFKEQDRMLRLLTKDYGKITTRAISARKQGSKLAGHLEPFIHSDFFIARSKTIDILAGSNVINSNAQLRRSISHSSVASFFSEVIDRFTEEGGEDATLYEFVQQYYTWLQENEAHVFSLYAAILQIFSLLGYHIELHSCHSCRKPISIEGSKYNYKLWNVECADCHSTDETMPLSADAIKVLRFFGEHTFSEVIRLHLQKKEWEEVHTFIHSLLRYNLDYELKSEAVFLELLK